MKINCKGKKGFTLIELLVVVLIIGVLAAISLPMYTRSLEKARAVEAVQVLSDVVQSENAYFLAKHRYSSDFDDMVIQSFENASGSTHSTKFFDYELTLERISAERDLGDDSYTLYRVFGDPRTYCEPEDSKYCKMFDLEAGGLGGGAAGERCDSEHIGYTCSVTRNSDGTFTEHLCDGNSFCVTTTYNADSDPLKSIQCYHYEGNTCTNAKAKIYDENGRLISSIQCDGKNIDEKNSWCSNYGGSKYIYDESGKIKAIIKCSKINNNGECDGKNGQTYYYDENGKILSKIDCSDLNSETGECSSYKGGTSYIYDKDGKKIVEGHCESFNLKTGECTKELTKGEVYHYDEKGNLEYSSECKEFSKGECIEYGGSFSKYDNNGNITDSVECLEWMSNGQCQKVGMGRTTYAYDASGNKISETHCTDYANDGTCITYKGQGIHVSAYDKEGKPLAARFCETYNSNNECLKYNDYGIGILYKDGEAIQGECFTWNDDGSCGYYEYIQLVTNRENGEKQEAYCRGYDVATGTCKEYQNRVDIRDSNGRYTLSAGCKSFKDGICQEYGEGSIYNYDSNGNRTLYADCKVFDSDGKCQSYERLDTYDSNGNMTSFTYCDSYNDDNTCKEYIGNVHNYDANGHQTFYANCKTFNPDATCSNYDSGHIETYDDHGNRTFYADCKTFDSDNKCIEYGNGKHFINQYDSNGNITSLVSCDIGSDGACKSYATKGEVYNYDSNGNQYTQGCNVNDNGTCGTLTGKGSVNMYDSNGNIIVHANCNSFNTDGTCSSYGSGGVSTYDSNGNQTFSASCKAFNSDGKCTEYGSDAWVSNYDSNGNQIFLAPCKAFNSDGTCKEYGEGEVAVYDSNQTFNAHCKVFDSYGKCQEYGEGTRTTYTYDSNGYQTSRVTCITGSDGSCEQYTEGHASGYDSNTNTAFSADCYALHSDGTCDKGKSSGTMYTYDSNGMPTGYMACTYSNGTCTPTMYQQYNGNQNTYTYDEHGNVTSESYCTGFSLDGKCQAYQTSATYQYSYDGQGNIISRVQDLGDGKYKICFYDTNYDGSQYLYNCEERSTGTESPKASVASAEEIKE